MSGQPITAVVVGAGNRAMHYASYAVEHSDDLVIAAVVEPNESRRVACAEKYKLSPEMCFESIEAFIAQPKMADCVINGTMDHLHVSTTIPLLRAGYDVLLEKPVASSMEDMNLLAEVAKETGRRVMVCHVLRYAPFYVRIHELIREGAIGTVRTISTTERVGYHHMASAFVRGRWNRRETSNPILLAKCCHDLDLVAWMMSGRQPKRVSSMGKRWFFREENAPQNAGTRCMVDCEIEKTCSFSARKLYLDQNLWGPYVWHKLREGGPLTEERKRESLLTDNPWGRCVWRCENNVVDQQSVIVEFEDGSIATHQLLAGTAEGARTIHLVGTEGEIEGHMEAGTFVIRKMDPDAGKPHFTEEKIELNVSADMHGGGDHRLVQDFCRVVRGQTPSPSTTDLMDSINGHLIVYAADKSMLSGDVVEVDAFLEDVAASAE